MSTIKDLIQEMKDMSELQEFTEKQYKTILELNRKVTELNIEISELKTSLAQSGQGSLQLPGADEKSSEQMICEVQLALLNNISMSRELTAEESKKVETYSKILAPIRANVKKAEKPAEKISTAELLKLVQNNE